MTGERLAPYPARVSFPDQEPDCVAAMLAEYAQHTAREDGSNASVFVVVSIEGWRLYVADDAAHAVEQHDDAFPEEGAPYLVAEVLAAQERHYRILGADEEGINIRYTYEQARHAGIEV